VRKSTVFLTGGAVVALAAAAVVRFSVVPGLLQLPADLDTTLHYTGTADILDPAALQTGDLAAAIKKGVPVTATEHVQATSTHGQTAVVTDEFTLTRDGNTKVSVTTSTYAVNRKSLGAVPAPSGTTVNPHEGLSVGFPLPPEQTDYTYWDPPTQTGATAAYQRTERHAGRDTYVYRLQTKAPLRDTASLGNDVPKSLPKSMLLALAPTLPPDAQQLMAQYAALLPDELPLAFTASADSTFWVDIGTGYVVDVTRKQVIEATLELGLASVPLGPVFSLDLRFAADTVKTISDDAATAQQGLTLLNVIVPIVLVVLAVLLVLVAVVLSARGRRGRRSRAPAPADRTPAATAGV
jgi:hypothetical protein